MVSLVHRNRERLFRFLDNRQLKYLYQNGIFLSMACITFLLGKLEKVSCRFGIFFLTSWLNISSKISVKEGEDKCKDWMHE